MCSKKIITLLEHELSGRSDITRMQFALTQRNGNHTSKDDPTLWDNIVHDVFTAKYILYLLFLCPFHCQVSFD